MILTCCQWLVLQNWAYYSTTSCHCMSQLSCASDLWCGHKSCWCSVLLDESMGDHWKSCGGELKFDYNYPHASVVKQITKDPPSHPRTTGRVFVWPLPSFVQTIIAFHCLISSLRLGLIVRSIQDWVIPLVYFIYRRSIEIIIVELHLTSTREASFNFSNIT